MSKLTREDKTKVEEAGIIGAVVGFALFVAAYYTSPSWVYLGFIFFGAAIAAATEWVRLTEDDD